ncbi:uncharacterized protein PFL1_03417 [Pseudozyma flocculosa PF-1]|uniref:Transcription activator of gluconeogenesis ERT1 n=2 Tax=Pseudozyma flocculosa TaxID=84751 RepID=A0A5C3F918_9BASI|nr:uncharacterized protein PFL1_03417 [Pseudozyma flocculosa PF-1]EPQ29129.1 hypothetical protein PFL1_03417 [Pseudozyma flocculosa PF-1]SPO40125.1 uncharacterized protein PSFLO_05607 [Pseudozyma flocculosa]
MSGRPSADPYAWGQQQAPPQPHQNGSLSGDPSMMQQTPLGQPIRHLQTPASGGYRELPLPSPNSSTYAASYMQARPSASPNPSMNYGMPGPMSGHHVGDPAAAAAAASSAYAPQAQIGQYGGGMPTGFPQYGSPGFYGAAQLAQHPDAMMQQHQHQQPQQPQHPYYSSQHPGSATIDPGVQTHPMYGAGPAHLDPGIAAHAGHFAHGDAGPMSAGPYDGLHGVGVRPKRKQVKNACVNCQKACKKCDEGRPCGRCVKYGLTDTCQDSSRKERRRGVKRGPYKRRATTGSQPAPTAATSMAGGVGVYGRESHMAPGGRSLDGVSSAPDETQLSSPGFGGQMIPPSRPPLSLGMQGSVAGSWQSTSSPSLRSADDDRDGRFGRAMGGGGGGGGGVGMPPGSGGSYYGYEGQEGGPSPYDRSSSAPIPGPGSLVLSPIGSLSRLQAPSGFSQSSGHQQLPSLLSGPSSSSNLNGLYNASASRPLISPSLHTGPSGGFLYPGSGSTPSGHSRLHSDGSFASNLNSASTSASTMSPRTPINGSGAEYQMMSPPVNGKFSASYVPPQPTVPTGASTFLSQDPARPFPLKMPKALPRNRSGTASSFLEAQVSRSRSEYESSHADSGVSNAPSLAPIRREASPVGQRSSPYMGASGHHLVHGTNVSSTDDLTSRRLGPGSGLTPRIELSSYPTPMSLSSGTAGGMAKREADMPGSLGLA